MPIKKKKAVRRKKINVESSLILKSNLKGVKYDDINRSSPATDRQSCLQIQSCRVIKNKIDKGGVKRIFSPFNRFVKNNSTRKTEKPDPKYMPYHSMYRHTGLSPKEKAYVICSCQTRSNRYVKLKNLAASAIKQNKIFCVYGSCNAVRKALLERGWVEKIPPNRMNLSRIRNGTFSSNTEINGELERLLLSNLVEKYNPNFIWRTKDEQRDTAIDMAKETTTIVNKLKTDAMWTTKQGLCSSMKRNYWFYIEDVAEVNDPRTYNSYDCGEIDSFIKNYKITTCTSLLKWILSMVANDRPVFTKTGTISLNVVVFALNRCKEYLFRKQHKDIDRSISDASSGQWNAFLKKYYRVIAKDDVFQADEENKLPLYLGYAKFLLKQIHKYRPQLSCEGCHNIWIIKPAHCSRGRGIRMASKLGVITSLLNKANSKYVIQKYIEEPLLIHETKFDIRQYYLVTNTYPLTIWMYRDCYLKFSSQKYNLKNYHESIHLTNNAIQKKYKNCVGRHFELPQNNMWSLEEYKGYLNRIGNNKVWDNVIYPGMKKSIIGIMLNCQDSMPVCRNRFELYGCDFILDKEYKPWLIEINSCPDLNNTTYVTANICPAVIADIIKVVIDYAANPKSSTGRFECIYKQPMSIPRYSSAADLYVRGISLPLDYFYRGNIEIKESYDNVDIEKEYDIKDALNKLKQYYDIDIMVQPEDEYSTSKMRKHEICAHYTESEYELSVAATVITEQLDELLDRITSECTASAESCGKKIKSSDSLAKSFAPVQSVKSLTDIKSLLKKSYSRFISAELIKVNSQKSFKFSKLDDGPKGKGSFIECNTVTNAIRGLCPAINVIKNGQVHETKLSKGKVCKSFDNILEATKKIVSFINQKEKECFTEFRSLF